MDATYNYLSQKRSLYSQFAHGVMHRFTLITKIVHKNSFRTLKVYKADDRQSFKRRKQRFFQKDCSEIQQDFSIVVSGCSKNSRRRGTRRIGVTHE